MNEGIEGIIFEYGKNLICYYNNVVNENYNIVLVGGLSFNIMSLPYTKDLIKFCSMNKLGLYIPQFRSHPNYGIYRFEDDLEDFNDLLKLINGKIIAIGNSTGCQVIMKTIQSVNNIVLCILQGPVSDVEYEEHVNPNLKNQLQIAEKSKGILPIKHEHNFITSERFISLFKRNGTEDMFSSYLDDDFYINLNPRCIRCVFVVSKRDEYTVKSNVEKLKKVKNSVCHVLEEGNHFLTNLKSKDEFMKIISDEIFKIINRHN